MNDMEKIERIEWHVNLGDLWQEEPEADVDVEASERDYVKRVENRLQACWPEAEIITHAHQATGWSRPVEVSGMAGTAECAEVEDVIQEVYYTFAWVVCK